jgi:hypothetical protein
MMLIIMTTTTAEIINIITANLDHKRAKEKVKNEMLCKMTYLLRTMYYSTKTLKTAERIIVNVECSRWNIELYKLQCANNYISSVKK